MSPSDFVQRATRSAAGQVACLLFLVTLGTTSAQELKGLAAEAFAVEKGSLASGAVPAASDLHPQRHVYHFTNVSAKRARVAQRLQKHEA